MSKESDREELQSLVDEYLNGGGEIEQIPEGVSKDAFRTINNKKQLYSLGSPKARAGISNFQRSASSRKGINR